MVVLLQRHGDLARVVHVDEFGLGIVAGHLRQAGDVGADDRVAVHHPLRERHDRDVAGRHLGNPTVVQVLVTLVLDGHGDEGPVRGHRDAVRLAAEFAARHLGAGGDVHMREPPRGRGVAPGRVDADEHGPSQRPDGGGLAAHRDRAAGGRGGRVGDVDHSDGAVGAVGIDQRHSVGRRVDDLGRGRGRRAQAILEVRGDVERRDPVEDGLGGRGERRDQRGEGNEAGMARSHLKTSLSLEKSDGPPLREPCDVFVTGACPFRGNGSRPFTLDGAPSPA